MATEARQIPFAEAVDFLRGKVNLPTRRWDDLRHDAHVRAFSVAGVTRDDMLADFRAAIEKARKDGTGLQEFRKDFDKDKPIKGVIGPALSTDDRKALIEYLKTL